MIFYRPHLISKAKIIVEHCSLSNKSPHKAVWTATQMMMVMMMIFIEQQGEQIRKTPTRDHKRLGDQWRPTSKNLEETDLARGCQSWYRHDIMIKFYQSNPVTVRFVISQRYGNQNLDSYSFGSKLFGIFKCLPKRAPSQTDPLGTSSPRRICWKHIFTKCQIEIRVLELQHSITSLYWRKTLPGDVPCKLQVNQCNPPVKLTFAIHILIAYSANWHKW